jgi:hypothetical protein
MNENSNNHPTAVDNLKISTMFLPLLLNGSALFEYMM